MDPQTELEMLQLQARALHASRPQGASDPIAEADMNAQAAAGIQAARDQATVAANPVAARVLSFDQGIPILGGGVDELRGALGGDQARDSARDLEGAFARTHPKENAALQLGGMGTSLVATGGLLPAMGSAGVLGDAAISAGLSGATSGADAYARGEGDWLERLKGSAIPAAIGTILGGGIGWLLSARAARKATTARNAAVPSVDALKTQAGALYTLGETTGKTASRTYTKRLNDTITSIAKQKELFGPDGKWLQSGNYPFIKDVVDVVGKYAGQPMTPAQMRAVRETIQAAAQSPVDKEARIGTMMLKRFDEFVDPLVPEFKQANKVYSKAMRGDEIQKAIETGGTRARRLGDDSAVRGQFENLERQGIRGDLTYPPELQQAVSDVAQGNTLRNTLSNAGSGGPMTRRGAVATVVAPYVLGHGAGMLTGHPELGPLLGGAASGTAALGSLFAKRVAGRLTNDAASEASAIARNGGSLPPAVYNSPAVQAVIGALAARGTAGPFQPQ